MKKFLHQAGGIARKVTAAAVKLAKKLAHMAAEAAVSVVAAVGEAATKLLGMASTRFDRALTTEIPTPCRPPENW